MNNNQNQNNNKNINYNKYTTILFDGVIQLDDSGNKINYLITNKNKNNNSKNITKILDTIYNSKNTIDKLIRVHGLVCENNDTFNGFAKLHIKKDIFGIEGYHVGNFALDLKLDLLVGKEVKILLEDYTNSLATEDYNESKIS